MLKGKKHVRHAIAGLVYHTRLELASNDELKFGFKGKRNVNLQRASGLSHGIGCENHPTKLLNGFTACKIRSILTF